MLTETDAIIARMGAWIIQLERERAALAAQLAQERAAKAEPPAEGD